MKKAIGGDANTGRWL